MGLGVTRRRASSAARALATVVPASMATIDPDAGRDLDEPRGTEAKAVPSRDPGVGGEHREGGVEGGVARTFQGAAGVPLAPQGRVGASQPPVDAPTDPDGKALRVLQHPVQVGDGGVGLPERPGKLREHQPPEIPRESGVVRHGAVELGHGLAHPCRAPQQRDPGGDARLEESLERKEERLVGPTRRALSEVGVSLLIAPTGDEPSHQHEDRLALGIRPADRLPERLELQIAHDRPALVTLGPSGRDQACAREQTDQDRSNASSGHHDWLLTRHRRDPGAAIARRRPPRSRSPRPVPAPPPR